MSRPAPVALLGLSLLLAVSAGHDAHAQPPRRPSSSKPDGAALLRMMGPRAGDAFAAPGSPGIGALVELPAGVRAADLGLTAMTPGLGRLWGDPARIVAFADAHPDLHVEVSPPLHLLLDSASGFVAARPANALGLDGSGVAIGVADTGLDVTHPDFLDAQGHTRVAWLLDLSSAPSGVHADLETRFGSTDGHGNLVAGAVWSAADIDNLLAIKKYSQLPADEVGHGTLVASCAGGNGDGGTSKYVGIAPKATLLIARITSPGSDSIGNDELLRGVAFLFDRAAAIGKPVVVNLSIGTDFGPHDGTADWEKALASYVGPDQPGRALVVAAGNSGSIAETPVHQNVYVGGGAPLRVPLTTGGASDGGVQVWVAMHAGADLKVGLDGPDGTWINPVGSDESDSKNTSDYQSGVYNGSKPNGSPVPSDSHGAVVVWQGKWPRGTYYITLAGHGTADLYEQGTGDASVPGVRDVGFSEGVREGTVNLPATSPGIIGVGCTINKKSWRSIHGVGLGLQVPVLDARGGMVDPMGAARDPVDGEPCWFSSAGPTVTGVPKPEIMAPGAAIVGAMSREAVPPAISSIFSDPSCPGTKANPNSSDPLCQQIDGLHAVSFGTSFSSPIVAGAVAVLLQHDPTLTQDKIVAALQGGAHRICVGRDTGNCTRPAFDDQAGPGEVDVLGSVAALDAMRNGGTALPDRGQSWMTLSADQYYADGSTPLDAIVELRASGTATSAPPPADGFGDGRLVAYALLDGTPYDGAIQSMVRRGPGVWVATVQLPAGLGGSNLTLGARFDGADIVTPRSVPIAPDVWTGTYSSSVRGGCSVSRGSADDFGWEGASLLGLAAVVAARARRKSP
jgi:subtilisin family serine protease